MAFQVCHLSCLKGQPVGRYHTSLTKYFSSSSAVSTKATLYNPQSPSDGDFGHNLQKKANISRVPVLRCSSSSSHSSQANLSDSKQLVELPLFPLPLVLFPGSTLPLQIFEFRYRIMMHTLLYGNQRFGVVYSDSLNGPVDVGCVGEVVKHERLVDDRFFVIIKGQERFRVVNGKPDNEAKDLRRNLFPTPFSFFVGSTFEGAPKEQQALLELEDTSVRLKREKKTLRNTLNYLAAASAIKDAFQYSSFNEN